MPTTLMSFRKVAVIVLAIKECNKCHKLLPADTENFHRNQKNVDGLQRYCKSCAYKEQKRFYSNNKEKVKTRVAEYARKNQEQIKGYKTEYQTNNKEYEAKRKRRWYQNNRELTINRAVANKREKRRIDPMCRLNDSIGGGIFKAIRENKAGHRWEELVGYTLSQLRAHIEKKFLPGMTWDNYGKWHIDHILPKASFFFAKASEDDFKKCWDISNLQPLWAEDNIRKGAKIVSGRYGCTG